MAAAWRSPRGSQLQQAWKTVSSPGPTYAAAKRSAIAIEVLGRRAEAQVCLIRSVRDDSTSRAEVQARHRGRGTKAQRDGPRVRCVAGRAAPARQNAGVPGRRDLHSEARRLRFGWVFRARQA